MQRVRYYSMLDGSGYCMAAAMNVRALLNSGVPVQWVPLQWGVGDGPPQRLDIHAALASRFVQINQSQQAWQDLPALLHATQADVDADTAVVHTVPEHWPSLRQAGLRNVGYTVWETNRLPLHWVPLCNAMQAILVPCQFNRAVFVQSGCQVPVQVVPHVRRSHWREFDPASLARCRADWALQEGVFTFYSINTWELRKNLARLIVAFAAAFTAHDPVQLVVKTSDYADEELPPYKRIATREILAQLLPALEQQLGRKLPAMHFIIDNEMPHDGIDALHQLGDCFVSLSRGEGWGLGSFDAATYGNPVLAPHWGGLVDYMPEDWSGAVPCHLAQVPIWPPHKPSYWSDQQSVDVTVPQAVLALQRAWRDSASRRQEALAIQAVISDKFSEYRVAATLREALA